jgi:lipoate-protein ligase A
MGKIKQMKNICVTSFEDLQTELNKMKKAGTKAFIGCCCEPFYNKHVDDFEKAGMPGILLNINDNTCYDLDQAKEAYQGTFANQTNINLGLLSKVLNI